jgi:hypothetical protein
MLLMLFAASLVGAQAVSTTTTTIPPKALPEPYRSTEFPDWLLALRRFEIISLGAFPIMLFYSRVLLDAGRFIINGFDAQYAPWPFKNELSYNPVASEQWLAVGLAGGLATTVGIIDFLLVDARRRKAMADRN